MFKKLLVCAFVLLPSLSAFGQNTFTIGGQNLVIGATDQAIDIIVNTDVTCYGVEFGLTYDPSVLSVTVVDTSDTLAAIPGVIFNTGLINNELGLLSWGIVYGSGIPGGVELPPSQNEVVASLIVNVVGAEAGETTIEFGCVRPNPEQVTEACTSFTSTGGQTIDPDETTSLPITISSLAAAITGVSPGSGRPGDSIEIAGLNFSEAGLEVKVCGAVVEAALEGESLTVTAPECATVGDVEVEVCNEHGCDTATFDYLSRAPVLLSVIPAAGYPGYTVSLGGEFLDQPGLMVSICGQAAQILQASAESVDVEAPECNTVGAVDIQITTARGSASLAGAFTYLSRVPVISEISPGEGYVGDTIVISGDFLSQSFLLVKVCEVFTEHTFLGNGDIEVTAPECTVGCAAVEVITIRGRDMLTEGFCYLPPPVAFIRSDANSDGRISIADPVTTLLYLFYSGNEPTCFDAADSDGNGEVSVTDPINTLNLLFTGRPNVSRPYPACGLPASGLNQISCTASSCQ